MLTARNKLASAEDNGVVIHNPLALTHTFQPCRPAYPEAWRQYHFDGLLMSGFWELLVLDPRPRGPGASWTRGVVGGYHREQRHLK